MPESNVFSTAGLILKAIKEEETTVEEQEQLQQWLEDPVNRRFYEELNDADAMAQEYRDYKSVDLEATWQKLWNGIAATESGPEPVTTSTPVVEMGKARSTSIYKYVYLAIAAIAVIAILIIGIYQYQKPQTPPKIVTVNTAVSPEPGSNKAVLVRSDGSRYELQDLPNGELPAAEGGIRYKKEDGKIICSPGASQSPGAFDSLIVPRGGQFTLVLPDGTEVSLNSASTIRYPTGFPDKERRVTITGEAYFEIAHDPLRPFIVSVMNHSLRALGTKFNVNAYEQEAPVKATLLEGKLLVSSRSAQKILESNYTALISPTAQIKIVPEENLSKIIAWKNGEFEFENEPVVSVANQLARWYNMRVFVEGKPTALVNYSNPMNMHIDSTLEAIKKGKEKIHISRTDSTIIVKP